METAERKTGKLRSWHENRGFGIIVSGETGLDRFFLHVTAIKSGTAYPKPGMAVTFSVAPPRRDGDLPQAVSADIDTNTPIEEAGKSTEAGAL